MAAIIGNLASTVQVYPVAALPHRITACIARNSRKLASCQSYMTEEDISLVLTTLNECWSLPLSKMNGRLTHWCEARCCRDVKETRYKVKRCLELLILQGFEVPLLYRWKHVQPAAEFCLRAMLIHGLLEHTWRLSLSEQSDPYSEPVQELLNYDEDNADLSPAEKQKVRATKVLQLPSGPEAVANFAKAVLLVKPLRTYMDEVSLAETLRLRMRLLRMGILPDTSTCDRNPERLVRLNLAILTGDRGLQVCADFMHFLRADPDGEVWHGELQLCYRECAPLLLMGMCDSWRRLHLAYAGLPWQCLRVAIMGTDDGIDCLKRLHTAAGDCSACQDRLFFQVARLIWRVLML
eukprot:s684_g11.t1